MQIVIFTKCSKCSAAEEIATKNEIDNWKLVQLSKENALFHCRGYEDNK